MFILGKVKHFLTSLTSYQRKYLSKPCIQSFYSFRYAISKKDLAYLTWLFYLSHHTFQSSLASVHVVWENNSESQLLEQHSVTLFLELIVAAVVAFRWDCSMRTWWRKGLRAELKHWGCGPDLDISSSWLIAFSMGFLAKTTAANLSKVSLNPSKLDNLWSKAEFIYLFLFL